LSAGVPVGSIVAGVLATVIGSLFAAGDAALQVLPEPRIQALATGEGSDAAAFRRYAAARLQVTSRWLAGRIVFLSLASALFSQAAQQWLAPDAAIACAVVGALFSYGTFAEVLSTMSRQRPERSGAVALRFLTPLEWVMVPLAWPLGVLGRLVGRRVPEQHRADPRMTETELEWAVSAGEKSGSIAVEPAEMIRNVLDFKDLTAREVMVPRRRISAIELATTLDEALALVTSDGHSRYPVYRETLDNVVGLLYVKDLFALVRDQRLSASKLIDIIRAPVLFVAETQPAASVLREMRAKRLHMAIVSDEFGGTGGLVTLEDILEEIVGEIHDEYDVEDHQIEKLGENRFVADAAIPLGDLATRIGKEITTDGDFESLGGMLVHRAGKVPAVGATLTVDGFTFIVREADETHIVKVEIVPEEEAKAAEPSPTAASSS
jgi:CBS domain containing-hemolysin-like protein